MPQGRPLKPGDLLPLGKAAAAKAGLAVPPTWRPAYPEAGAPWEISVLPGPNSSPDYFSEDDITTLHSATYTVHYNSCASIAVLAASVPVDTLQLCAKRYLQSYKAVTYKQSLAGTP